MTIDPTSLQSLQVSRRNKSRNNDVSVSSESFKINALRGATSVTHPDKYFSGTSGLEILHLLSPGVVSIEADSGKLHRRIKILGKTSRWFDVPKRVRPTLPTVFLFFTVSSMDLLRDEQSINQRYLPTTRPSWFRLEMD